MLRNQCVLCGETIDLDILATDEDNLARVKDHMIGHLSVMFFDDPVHNQTVFDARLVTEQDPPVLWEDNDPKLPMHLLFEAKKTIAELEDQLNTAKKELGIAQGELSVNLNNWEQAKGKIRREKQELYAYDMSLREKARILDLKEERDLEEVVEERFAKLQMEVKEDREAYKALKDKLSSIRDILG